MSNFIAVTWGSEVSLFILYFYEICSIETFIFQENTKMPVKGYAFMIYWRSRSYSLII